MPEPKGNLVTPIGIDGDDNLWALLVDAEGHLQVDIISQGADIDIRDINEAQDDILVYGTDAGATNRKLRTDAEGRLEVIQSMHTTAKAKAYLSVDQEDIANGVATKILLDVVTDDPSSMFTPNKFTIKVAGYYIVTGQVAWTLASIVADKGYFARIHKNGVLATSAGLHSSIVGLLTNTIHDIIHCAVDDYLELFCRHLAGVGTLDIQSEERNTFFAIHLLSAD